MGRSRGRGRSNSAGTNRGGSVSMRGGVRFVLNIGGGILFPKFIFCEHFLPESVTIVKYLTPRNTLVWLLLIFVGSFVWNLDWSLHPLQLSEQPYFNVWFSTASSVVVQQRPFWKFEPRKTTSFCGFYCCFHHLWKFYQQWKRNFLFAESDNEWLLFVSSCLARYSHLLNCSQVRLFRFFFNHELTLRVLSSWTHTKCVYKLVKYCIFQ